VALADGEEIHAPIVISNLDVRRTFLETMQAKDLPDEFVQQVRNFKIRGSSGKLNIALDGMPDFPAIPAGSPSLRGKHYMSVFVQYCPYRLADGEWTAQKRAAFGATVIDTIARQSPNFKSLILHAEIRTPWDIENEVGLTEGNIFQGELTLDQLLFNRPIPGYAQYRAPVRGVYMCGSSTHPGGGVMGAPGANAARAVLRDLGKMN
jgi:phytoene dehydrogenase-like protein